MDLKQFFVTVLIVSVCLIGPLIVTLSLKSRIVEVKGQVSTLQEFIDSQKEWNLTSTSHDTVFDKRLDMLEQKMRKVYQGYDVKPSKLYDLDSLYQELWLGKIIKGYDLSEIILH